MEVTSAPTRRSLRSARPERRTVDVDVVVVGAGRTGLGAARHLRRAGLAAVGDDGWDQAPATFVVLDEAAWPGGPWRERWPGLPLAATPAARDLPGLPLVEPDLTRPARDALPAYYARYEDAYDLRVLRPVRVDRVEPDGDRLAVHARMVDRPDSRLPGVGPDNRVPGVGPDNRVPGVGPDNRVPGVGPDNRVPGVGPDGDALADTATLRRRGRRTGARSQSTVVWRARGLVNATGSWSRPFWPHHLGQDAFVGRQLHQCDLHDLSDLTDGHVVVVGPGPGVVHLLADIAQVTTVTWATRVLPPVTDADLTPAVRAAAEHGVLTPRPMFDRIGRHGVWFGPDPVPDGWADGPAHVAARTIVWATGFRPALSHLSPLHLRLATTDAVVGPEVLADRRVQLVGSCAPLPDAAVPRLAVRNLRRHLGL